MHDVAQLVEMGVERVLLAVDRHPFGHQRAAAADDARHPALAQRQVLAEHAGVDGHVIDALRGLLGNHVQKVPRPHVGDVVELLGHLVDRDRADRHRGGGDDPAADRVDVRAGGEVHHRVGPVADRHQQLLQFALGIARNGRLADVRVDLRPRGDPNADGSEALAEVDLVGGDDHPPSATSCRTNSGSSCSARATASISAVTRPALAYSIWVMVCLRRL